MARPRIFVSSTYFDLRHIRRHVESFIKQMGYESVLFESGDIPFHHDQPLDESCYAEIETCHILILIIGGRYGSAASSEDAKIKGEEKEKIYHHYNSITKKEYEKARSKQIPIFIFVEKGVFAEYDTYKKNRANTSINFAYVDSLNVFKLLDEIISQRTNNFVRGFDNFDDITSWLKEQWAGIFADFLSKRSTDIKIKNLKEQIEELKEISTTLKVYNELLVQSSNVQGGDDVIKQEEKKLGIRKAGRFKKEPFANFLIRHSKSKHISTIDLFNLFQGTSTLEEFGEKLDLDPEFKDLNDRAHTEYKRLRNVYLDENNLLEHDNEESSPDTEKME